MALLKVLTAPDPRLKLKAKPVASVDETVRELMHDMLETMYAEDGIGLAAIQVGVEKRVVVINVDYNHDNPGTVYKMANPEILWMSEEKEVRKDGCISVPGYWTDLARQARVKVQYLDENDQSQTLEAEGLLAFCIQHEVDHLNGILFIDHLSSLKRELALSRSRKHKNRA